MKIRKFVWGVTFFTTEEMYYAIKEISDKRKVALSEFLRAIISEYLETCSERSCSRKESRPRN